MYSVKSFDEITLMHLLTIVIFTHFTKIQRTFFYNNSEITQKK